jgi:hypothetical protein
MVNISQVEFSNIPIKCAEGQVFNLGNIALKGTDEKPVPLKLAGKEQ